VRCYECNEDTPAQQACQATVVRESTRTLDLAKGPQHSRRSIAPRGDRPIALCVSDPSDARLCYSCWIVRVSSPGRALIRRAPSVWSARPRPRNDLASRSTRFRTSFPVTTRPQRRGPSCPREKRRKLSTESPTSCQGRRFAPAVLTSLSPRLPGRQCLPSAGCAPRFQDDLFCCHASSGSLRPIRDHCQQIGLAHNEVLLVVQCHFGPRVLGEQRQPSSATTPAKDSVQHPNGRS
jgi:hypothetical protein